MTANSTKKTWRNRLALGWLICWALLAGGLLCKPLLDKASAVEGAESSPRTWKTKDIKDIQAGNLVLAREEFGEAVAPKRVVQVFHNTSDHLRILRIRSGDGTEQEIKTTDGHPFWVERKGWVDARDLELGARVGHADGSFAAVVATTYESHAEGVPIFNFEVEGYHTYFVAQSDAHDPLSVHNASKRRKPDLIPIDRLQKELGLSKEQRRLLHDEITGLCLSPVEIRETAEQIKVDYPGKKPKRPRRR